MILTSLLLHWSIVGVKIYKYNTFFNTYFILTRFCHPKNKEIYFFNIVLKKSNVGVFWVKIFYSKKSGIISFGRFSLNWPMCQFSKSNIRHKDFRLSVRPLFVRLMVPPRILKGGGMKSSSILLFFSTTTHIPFVLFLFFSFALRYFVHLSICPFVLLSCCMLDLLSCILL